MFYIVIINVMFLIALEEILDKELTLLKNLKTQLHRIEARIFLQDKCQQIKWTMKKLCRSSKLRELLKIIVQIT